MIRIEAEAITETRSAAIDPETLRSAAEIVADVRRRGEPALRAYSEQFADIEPGAPLFVEKEELESAYQALAPDQRAVLDRTATRIHTFALAQRACLTDLKLAVECGFAGHEAVPVARAGCYAPGGRFPLPSSVLMTAVTARAAGVGEVWVASPKPTPITLAAAFVAGADGLLRAGGAQAIAALAYGCGPVPACAAVVGPGNRWVTAAKQLVSGHVAIDMLAGPSELAIVAAPDADPALVAADLLAQAEHDPDASAYLITWSTPLIEAVEEELATQIAEWAGPPTRSIDALGRLIAVLTRDETEAADACNRLAPEHLQLAGTTKVEPAEFGALFQGDAAAEVFGDYGAGPNHTLPTGGTARSFGGLSVFTFLRIRTWMKGDRLSVQLRADAIELARWEGLEAHARAAECRAASTD